jgi:hypothetical protein
MACATGRRLGGVLTCLMAICVGPLDGLARVGVTSAADGDPLGKPPNEQERILRIGIDVQANELVTTRANDRAHLVFLDGSSLTVGPNARVTIDRFVFDPAAHTGDLAISATQGVFRLVGGKISKKQPITISTPSGTIGIRGGITILSVSQATTVADFVFGASMSMTSAGVTQTATRAGSQIIANAGTAPGAPALVKQGGLAGALKQLEGAASNGNKSADASSERSGFSNQNSGQAPAVGPSGPPNVASNTLTTALSNANAEALQTGRQTTAAVTVTVIAAAAGNPRSQPVVTAPAAPTVVSPTVSPATLSPPKLPTPPGTLRTSKTLTGFVAGVAFGQPGGALTPSSSPNLLAPGAISITTDAATGEARGTIAVSNLSGPAVPSTTTLQLGGLGGRGTANSSFIDDKTYLMVTQYNDISRLSSWQTQGRTTQATDTSVIATASAAPIPFQIPAQGTPGACACEFLSWGWWGSKVPDPSSPQTTYTAVGAYVAGTPTTAIQMPLTGTATYSGFMSGIVNNNGQVHGSSGSYQNVWNFATRSGAFTGSFDGRAYQGATQGTLGTAGQTFTGNFTGGGQSGALNGGFFAAPGDAVKYQAGTFAIGTNQSSYKASGVFAGQR